MISLSGPIEAANGFVRLGKEYYKQQRNIDGVIAIGEAGAGFCIKSAAAAKDVETATSLKTFAKTIAYNAAANCWPGWGDEGVEIEDAHLEAGLKLAVLARDLVRELELGAKEIGTSHWLVGALKLAAGRLQEATVDFEKSEKAYEFGGYQMSRLLARGYSALARKRGASTSALGATALADMMKSLREEGSKEAIFFANQLATADRIFCKDVPLDNAAAPDSSAVRVALWRAIHVQADAPPHVLDDEIGLRLVAPDEGWSQRPDMHPEGTKLFRAAIVARARFIEDLVIEQAGRGSSQYVILGAGLDSFVQRRPEMASRLTVFEIDQPGTQAWKRQRLIDLGFGVPDWLRFVPVDFEGGGVVVGAAQGVRF
ncbi:class I SAM-dependent methyltransferase [Rhodoplanes sp. Z2-YC6860]|uniref:class I SAM-dependent methyltransferase n=1 Tax=Rhodoplanes sp. Z2-YC6860 TaxID=674703 RepID=UPI0018DC3B0E|nr:class I SAM-dependent methyltransferase [Rhodoplanes sp. Z2-YC6860]